MAGPHTTDSAPSLTDSTISKSSVIVAEGAGHSLHYYWQGFGLIPWHAEVAAGTASTYGGPSVIENSGGSIVAAQGPSGSLRFYWQYYGHRQWNAEHVAGARTTNA